MTNGGFLGIGGTNGQVRQTDMNTQAPCDGHKSCDGAVCLSLAKRESIGFSPQVEE